VSWSALFRNLTCRTLAVHYRRFGTLYRPIFTVKQSKALPKFRQHTTNLCLLRSQTPDGSATPRQTPEFLYGPQSFGPWFPTFRKHQLSKHGEPLVKQHSIVYPNTGNLRNDFVRTAKLTSKLMLEMSCYLTQNSRHATLTLVAQKTVHVT
jgi:hypothetical protein